MRVGPWMAASLLVVLSFAPSTASPGGLALSIVDEVVVGQHSHTKACGGIAPLDLDCEVGHIPRCCAISFGIEAGIGYTGPISALLEQPRTGAWAQLDCLVYAASGSSVLATCTQTSQGQFQYDVPLVLRGDSYLNAAGGWRVYLDN